MSLYLRMALQNIRKNARFFIPRILTEAGLLACYFIVYTLYRDERIRQVRGGSYLPFFMFIGVVVITLLSIILMLYTNSFLMKQRKREFGLYNVLGMEKRHVVKVLFHESLISSVCSIITGIILGIIFYKLSSLFICRLLGVESILGFYYISAKMIVPAVAGFVIIDVFTYICNCISIARMKPVELMASIHTGEKEPKVKWLTFITGILCLAGGYYIALSVKNPLSALSLFFAAVLLVIVGTYYLFMSGTIFVLKLLKNKKEYYYRPGHMTAVSGLLYRMKQNAVGLASICILATGVLVMISTTVSLYAGAEEMLRKSFSKELYMETYYFDGDGNDHSLPSEVMAGIVYEVSEKHGLEVEAVTQQHYLETAFSFDNGVCITDRSGGNMMDAVQFFFMTEEEYIKLTGEKLGLSGDDIAFKVINAGSSSENYKGNVINIGGTAHNIVRRLERYPVNLTAMSVFAHYGVVVSDDEALEDIFRIQSEAYGGNASTMTERIEVKYADRNAAREAGDALSDDIRSAVRAYVSGLQGQQEENDVRVYLDTLWQAESDYSSMYGSFLFLGILLGFVCLFATALIIYYKQISEGYEDRNRYQIMTKIGMSQKEVKKSIGSQVLLVFFLPLIVAGIHICFAFPLLKKLLNLLMLSNTMLFVVCTVITFLVFALVYVMIYGVTAKHYYRIVR